MLCSDAASSLIQRFDVMCLLENQDQPCSWTKFKNNFYKNIVQENQESAKYM